MINRWFESQEILTRSAIFQAAVNEQLKSQAAEDGLEKGKRGSKATPQQIIGCRRSQEKILNAMCDRMPVAVRPKQSKIQEICATPPTSKRKRRRGPRYTMNSVRY